MNQAGVDEEPLVPLGLAWRASRAAEPVGAGDGVGGELGGGALFVDVSGFTSLTEELIAHGRGGAEALAAALAGLFDPLIDEVLARGGDVVRFAGDAFTAVFEDPDGAARAEAASAAIASAALRSGQVETPFGRFELRVRVSVGAGRIRWAVAPTVGQGWTWVVWGEAVDRATGWLPDPARAALAVEGERAAGSVGSADSGGLRAAVDSLSPGASARPQAASGAWANGEARDALAGSHPAMIAWANSQAAAQGALAGSRPGLIAWANGEAGVQDALAGALPAVSAWANGEAGAQAALAGSHPGLSAWANGEAKAQDALAGSHPGLIAWANGEAKAEDALAGSPAAMRARANGEAVAQVSAWVGRLRPPRIGARAELRMVAALFVAFGEVDGPAALAAELARLAEPWGALFGGLDRADKGWTAVFHLGAPVGHDDDVDRALRLAVAIRERLADLRWRAGLAWGLHYAGANGGRRRHDYTALGAATNLAARLAFAGPWGEVACDGEVVRRVARWRFEPLPAVAVKGLHKPVVPFRPLERLERAPGRDRIVGREPELAALRGALEAGGWVWVEAPDGMGRTALLGAASTGAPGRWWAVTADAMRSADLSWFSGILRAWLDSPRPDRGALEAAVDALIAGLPDGDPEAEEIAATLARTTSFLGALLGLRWAGSLWEQVEPRLRFESMLQGLTAVLAAALRAGPVTLVVDDAHNLDLASRSAWLRVVAGLEPGGLRVIAAVRPDAERGDGGSWRFATGLPEREVKVGPLAADAVAELCEAVLGARPDPDALAHLVARTRGQPLLAMEWLRWARESGRGAAALQRTEDVPDDLHALLAARIDRFDEPSRVVLQAAAVLGDPFPGEALPGMAPEVQDTDEALERLRRGGAVEAERGVWRFVPSVLRDAAWSMQTLARRQVLHRRAAEALGRGARREVAWHLERAGERTRARPVWLDAAREAMARFAHDEALDAIRRTQEGAAPDSLFVDAALLAAEVYEGQGMYEDALVEVEAGLAAQLAEPSERAAWEVAVALGAARGGWRDQLAGSGVARAGDVVFVPAPSERLGRVLGARCRALELVERVTDEDYGLAFAVLRAVGDWGGLAACQLSRGGLLRDRGRFDESLAEGEAAVEAAIRAGDRALQARARGGVANVLLERGEIAAAERVLAEAEGLFVASGLLRLAGVARANLATCARESGRTADAVVHNEEAIRLFTAVGDLPVATVVRGNLALALHDLGRLEEAELALRTAVAGRLATTIGTVGVNQGLQHARVLRHLGRIDEAQERLEALAARAAELAPLDLVAAVERGHIALAIGADVGPALAEARRLATENVAERWLRQLQQLEAAARVAAEGGDLVCGESVDALPIGLASRLKP